MDFEIFLRGLQLDLVRNLTYGFLPGIARANKITVYHPNGGMPIFDYGILGDGAVMVSLRANANGLGLTNIISLLGEENIQLFEIDRHKTNSRYQSVKISQNSFVRIINNKFVDDINQPDIALKGNKSKEPVMKELNVIKYGPPGTGKTYSMVEDVLSLINYKNETYDIKSIHKIIRTQPDGCRQVEFITFHQSYSYEEFVEGIRAEVVNSQVNYKVHNGIFKRLCRRAYFQKVKSLVNSEKKGQFSNEALAIYESLPFNKMREHNAELANLLLEYETKVATEKELENIPKFVLCIDEINRANISRVFGELITLIEDTKRQGAKETISVTLPYSGDEFFVPDNLYILGTMNTADRSLAKLDLALRRRFHFEDYYPDLGKVKNETAKVILEKLNTFISKELDREHTIGHSYLMTIEQNAVGEALNEALRDALNGKIVPLLEEYFLHEPSKVKDAFDLIRQLRTHR